MTTLTRRQFTVLRDLSYGPSTPARLGVRSDVLWRLVERGWASAGMPHTDRRFDRYSITAAGRAALDAHDLTS